MDIRAGRTRAALHQTILTLAASQDISEITVASVARTAQINRVTFYSHAVSPAALLTQALRGELDGVRDKLLHSGALNVKKLPAIALSEHLVDHLDVYQRNLPVSGQGILADFLTSHFAQSVHLVFAENPAALRHPTPSTQLSAPDTINAAAQFISRGVIGIIAVWLHASPTPDQAQLVLFLDRLLPSWWLDLVQEETPPRSEPPARNSSSLLINT